jgi:hypothetical protein
MKTITDPIKNENGSAIVIAMMILAIVTIIGVFSLNTSVVERKIATNLVLHKIAFYAAESGWERMVNWLDDQFPYITNTQTITENLKDSADSSAQVSSSYSAKVDFDGVKQNLPGYSSEFKKYLYTVKSTGSNPRGSKTIITVTAGKIVYVGGY